MTKKMAILFIDQKALCPALILNEIGQQRNFNHLTLVGFNAPIDGETKSNRKNTNANNDERKNRSQNIKDQ